MGGAGMARFCKWLTPRMLLDLHVIWQPFLICVIAPQRHLVLHTRALINVTATF